MASVMGDVAQSPPSSSFHQAIATNSPAISTTTTTSTSSSSSLATPELKSPLTRFELMGPSVASSSESPESPPSPSLLRDRDSNRVWAAKRIAEMSPESLQLLSPQRPPTSPSSPPSPYSPPSPSVAGGMQSSETPRNQVICVGGGSSVVSAHTHYSTSEVTNNCAASASKDVLEFASATGLNLDGFDSTTFCVLDCYLETAKVSGNSHEWVLRELEVFLLSKKQSNNIIDKVQEAKDDIIDHQKEMIGDVLAKLNNLTHQVQRMERQQLRNNKKSSETLGTIAEGVAFTQDTMNQIIGTDTGDSLEGNDGGEKADASTGAEIEEYVEAKPPAREVLGMPYDNTAVGENAGFSSSALPPRPMSGPPRTVIATAVGGGGAIEDCDEMTIASTGGRSICSTSSGRKFKSLYPPGQTPMQALASKLTEGLKSVSMQETTTLANKGDATCTTPVWLDPSIASDIEGVLPSDPTSMVLATDTDSASGTSRPILISAPPTTDPIVEPLADSSTAELASSVTDNPIRPASNEATEDAKAAGAAGAHGGTKATADVTDIGANASISMVPTSSAPSLLSEDAVETPRPAPNKVSCTKSDTFPVQSNKVAGSTAMPEPPLVSRTDRAEITNKANVQGRRIGALHGTTSLPSTTDALGKTLAIIRAKSTENLGSCSSNLVARRSGGKENGPTSANAPTTSRRGLSARPATNSIPFSTTPAKASVKSSEGDTCSASSRPYHRDYRKMMTRKDPLPTIIYFDVDFKKEEQLTVPQVLPILKKIFDSGIGDPERLQRAADALNDCLEKRGLDHPKCRLRLLQFIADNVSHRHLNHCRPKLSNAFHKLFRVSASQLSTMSSLDVKPLIPMLLAMSSEFLMEPRGPMSSTNLPKTISARNCANQLALLVSANDPMQFMFIGRQLGNAIIETNKPAQKIGCAHALAIVVEIAPSELIVSLERGTGKKTTKELLSRASIDLLAGRNGGEDVRNAGKMLCHHLKAKGYVEIFDRIREKLSKSQKSYLDRSKAAAEKDWERFGAKWLSENSRLN